MKVVIAGGGNVGTYIADELRRADHDVVIVEVDPRRVAEATKAGEPAGRQVAAGRRLRGVRADARRPGQGRRDGRGHR